MSIHPAFQSLTSTLTRRRLNRRRPPASRLCLEALEDRALLSFSPAVSYPVGANPQAVVTGDFNGDGRLDLAVANSTSNTVSLLLVNANGTFLAARNFATGVGPTSVAVGDFNKDGKLDLATGNASDVSILLGNGTGTLGAPKNTSLGMQEHSVAVGDFNGDGKLDLGVASSIFYPGSQGDGYGGGYPNVYANAATVLLGNGTGALAPAGSQSVGNGDQSVRSAAVADFNGDGRDDFVTLNSVDASGFSGDEASVLLANPSGSLGNRTVIGVGSTISFGFDPRHAVATGDVNGDGKADLVTANFFDGDVKVFLGTGTGSFGAARIYSSDSPPRSVALADFNGDGKIDLVTVSAGGLSVLLGNGTGSFKGPVIVNSGTAPDALAAGDFNGDGRRDVVTSNSSTNNVSVLLNDGTWPAADTPSISVNDVTVTEGNSGTTAANFTVSLSAAYAQPVTIHYATANGTAFAGSDYQAASGTLTFAAGVTSRTITVLVIGDRDLESSESFWLRLTSPTNAFVADSSGTGTILDDEPFVDISGSSAMEGNSGTTPFTFTVTLSNAYDVPVTVQYETSDLTSDETYYYGLTAATAGVDYAAKSGTVTFAPGQTRATITVLVSGERVGESDETFAVYLTGTTAGLMRNYEAYATIVNDDPLVSIGGGGTVVEGNAGTKSVTFTVNLSAASDAPLNVTYATADGTATVAGGDYRAASGTLTFAPGQTSKSISVLVNGDRVGEADEYFTFNLTAAGVNTATAYAVIQDDEPRIGIDSVSVNEGNSGSKLMTFTVTLSAAYDQPVTVNFATHDDSATVAGGDYAAKSGTLTFAPGQTTKTFTVTIKGDTKNEPDESFYVLLSGASNSAFIPDAYGWGTILSDDTSPRRKR
jgi:hypothetical protein